MLPVVLHSALCCFVTSENWMRSRTGSCLSKCPTGVLFYSQYLSRPTFCQLQAASIPADTLLLTIHARPWCNRSSSKLVTISQNFFSRKYCWNNNTALPWELKDNCMSLWHCCFISFMLHFWFPPESCFLFPPLHIFISGT